MWTCVPGARQADALRKELGTVKDKAKAYISRLNEASESCDFFFSKIEIPVYQALVVLVVVLVVAPLTHAACKALIGVTRTICEVP